MTDALLTDRAWLWAAAVLYLAGFLSGTITLIRHKRYSNSLTFFIMAAGFALQTLGLYLRGHAHGGCPISNPFEILQFTTWSATALYFIIGATFRLSLLGYFTALFATIVSLVSLAAPAWDTARRVDIFGGNPWIEFHAALALFSYGVFALLALTSLMFLLQWFSLKRQQIDGIFSFLPPMNALDKINLRLHTTGVILLAASLAVACAWWLRNTAGGGDGGVGGGGAGGVNAPMLILAALWLLYTIALALRLAGALAARLLAWTCIALFLLAIFSIGAVSKHSAPAQPAPTAPAAPQP